MKLFPNKSWSGVRAQSAFLINMTILAGACAPRAHPPIVSIQTSPETVTLSRNDKGVTFTLTSVIRNEGPGPLYLFPCGPDLNRLIGDSWVSVWTAPCALSSPLTQIDPGDSLTLPVRVVAYSDPASFPRLDPRLTAGQYRLVWDLAYRDDPAGPTVSLPGKKRVSSIFSLREP